MGTVANWQKGPAKGKGKEDLPLDTRWSVATYSNTVGQALHAGGAQLAWLRSALGLESSCLHQSSGAQSCGREQGGVGGPDETGGAGQGRAWTSAGSAAASVSQPTPSLRRLLTA